MSYNYIINPNTNNELHIHSEPGKLLIKKFLLEYVENIQQRGGKAAPELNELKKLLENRKNIILHKRHDE